MSRVDPRTPRRGRQTAVAWGVMLASLLVLASLFNAVASSALGGPSTTAPTPVRLSPATAALADGDHVRARLLARLPTHGLGTWADPPQKNCVPPHC
jgi:hypothetical protein